MNSRYAALLGDCTMLMNSRGKFPFKHNFSESIHSFSLNKRKICTLLQISTNKTSNVNPKKSSECLTIHSNINCFPQKKNGLNSEKWKKLNSWAAFWIYHNKWDLVGDSGGSPGLENAVKRWNGPIGPICFSVYVLSCESVKNVWVSPWKKYERAREKHPCSHVFHGLAHIFCHGLTPYGVGWYCDMALSPTISHLLWDLPIHHHSKSIPTTYHNQVLC